MSAPTVPLSASTPAPASRALPPYAGPLHVTSELTSAVRVGPFVPAPQRRVVSWEPPAVPAVVAPSAATPAVTAIAMATPAAAAIAMATPVTASPAVEEAAATLAVPASIPPYRPLRPTPIVSPAIRTPLYIPPIPTPTGEMVVEDEGVIEPQIIHTAEFAIPELATETPASSMSAFAENAGEGSVEQGELRGDAALPWIDSFLASTPALSMEAVADAPEAPSAELQAETELEAFVADDAVPDAGIIEQVNAVDEWPLDEAAVEFRALRTAMDEHSAPDAPVAQPGDAVEAASVAPLPEWSDDDLMDIMPFRHSGKTPLSSAAIPPDGELWADRARKAHEEAQMFDASVSNAIEQPDLADSARAQHLAPVSTAEEAAHALELLARRVRAGELTLPSYDPRMGEPAALVAALAALLGVKLR